MCFQNMLELKNTYIQKQGPHFENMLLGLTYTNNGSYMGQQTDLSLPLYI